MSRSGAGGGGISQDSEKPSRSPGPAPPHCLTPGSDFTGSQTS